MACTGLPRASDRNNRVRMIYSLRQEASAVRRVKARLSVRTTFCVVSSSSSWKMAFRESGPGKKCAKALLQACGPVTRSWKRLDTSATDVKSVGARCASACVKTSGLMSAKVCNPQHIGGILTIWQLLNSAPLIARASRLLNDLEPRTLPLLHRRRRSLFILCNPYSSTGR